MMLRENPNLDDLYFMKIFIGGLKEEIKTLVGAYNITSLMEACATTVKQERIYEVLCKKPKSSFYPTNVEQQNPDFQSAYQPQGNFKPQKFSHKSSSYTTDKPKDLCYRCKGPWVEGHQCNTKESFNTMEVG